MRIFKKSLALALAVAMMLSMVSFGVFADAATPELTFNIKGAADATTTISGAKAGKTIWVEVWLTPGTYTSAAVNLTPVIAVADEDVTSNYGATTASNPVKTDGTVQYKFTSSTTVDETTPLMVVKMTIPSDQVAGAITLFSPAEGADNIVGIESLTIGSSEFTVLDSFDATADSVVVVEPATVNVAIGTSLEDVKKELPTLVTVKETDAVDAKKDDKVKVGWACADYDATAPADYTFTGTLSADDSNAVNKDTLAAVTAPTITVTVDPATDADSNSVPTTPIKLTQKDDKTTAFTEEELKAFVVEKVGVITVTKGAISDTYATSKYTVAVKPGEDLSTTNTVGDTVVMEITLGGASDNAKFNLIDVLEVTIEIKKENVGGGTPVAGLPTGGSAPSTPSNPGIPTDPGTDEPGTEEPGTEEPGTEEPGTDVPGTDAPATSFEDVPADHWAGAYIETLKEAGIVGGKTATTFAPDDNVTRGEIAKMIAVAFNLEATNTESVFEDCAADAWYTPYVVACQEAGFINGVSDTAFAPEEKLTREQICAILFRALGLEAVDGELVFADAANVSDWAIEAVKALVAAGVLNGYEDGTFAPAANATRAEVAKILCSVLDMMAAEEEAPAEDAEEEATEEVVEEEATEEVVEEETTEEEVVEEETTEEEVVEEETEEVEAE